MPDTAEDLRATSDGLMRDLEVLSTLEDEKRTMEPGDERLVEMARRVEEIARRVLASSTRQRRLTEVGSAKVEAGSSTAPDASINDTPRPMADILAEWRAVERQLAAAEPGSVDAAEASALAEHLRDEYRRAHEARKG